MNLRDFFRDFQSNLDTLRAISPEEFRAVSSLSPPVESFRSVSQYVEDSSSHIRPTANAAYLHAMRMYRPSHRIRSLRVHHPEPYRGANNYNPQYLWTGLGWKGEQCSWVDQYNWDVESLSYKLLFHCVYIMINSINQCESAVSLSLLFILTDKDDKFHN